MYHVNGTLPETNMAPVIGSHPKRKCIMQSLVFQLLCECQGPGISSSNMKTSIWVSRSNGGQFWSNFGGSSEMLQMDPGDEPRSFSMFQNVHPDENAMILKMLIAKGGGVKWQV